MVRLINNDVILVNNNTLISNDEKNEFAVMSDEPAKKGTMTYSILKNHNTSQNMEQLKIRFDAMASHDITYVGIVQTARASGLEKFPMPYVLTNCHNSLCAVGGTINEDDHLFGLSAAEKYGGIYVPAHQAVIHQYMREAMAGCGKMILGSDSHTRYGVLGTMAIGEGGPELVKQLLGKTYDLKYPEVIAVYLEGKVSNGVGPQDVALTIIKAVFDSGFVKNKILEFVGPGIEGLSVDFRNGIDVMTTETTCLSSIWTTDEKVEKYLDLHQRKLDYKTLKPDDLAFYDGALVVDLSSIKPMIAMPFHPSNVYSLVEFKENQLDILNQIEKEAEKDFGKSKEVFRLTDKVKNGQMFVDQGIVAGCSGGTYENIALMASAMNQKSIGSGNFSLSVYPASQPIFFELNKNGSINKLMEAGVNIKTAFCGPCFGAGDVPSNNGFSIRHTTRNFPSREGSKPSDGQIAYVALMDSKSIAATAINGGRLTGGDEMEWNDDIPEYQYNQKIYENRVYYGFNQPKAVDLQFGPNIKDWPEMIEMTENLLLVAASVIMDPVTTTDELIPSGETSSYRSNPIKLAEFTLSRKDPGYVPRAKKIQALENERTGEKDDSVPGSELDDIFARLPEIEPNATRQNTSVGSFIYAVRPGDGSAREQAASCQKVLGGWANIAKEYATKRYRSNCINWGIIPFEMKEDINFKVGDYLLVPGIKKALKDAIEIVEGYVFSDGQVNRIVLSLPDMSADERRVLISGCLMNYYKMEMESSNCDDIIV
jgi:aconitate hydratase